VTDNNEVMTSELGGSIEAVDAPEGERTTGPWMV
jgi:hypothetical protein